ncbi:uncharacterized protein mtsh isoform X2 [Euwallacea fornicatus]|uniref:uncharacterized protein mtsh isoform X2 n=1 Tax=Euwallacea fornicatus TaxID=995702 RepID=UPI00338FBB0E
MDQNRPENTNNQHQNVHLHMHHVCNCQGIINPGYYPTVGYRTPIPQLLPYHTPSALVRPYLQHYQYTQFNVGSQYTVPISHVTGSSTSVYGPTTSNSSTVDLVYGAVKERRERDEGNGDTERVSNEPLERFDYGQIASPANELLITDISEQTAQENFIKFLERSCLTAEQIAYRNRNRPCFRNIQNLCIRTRSEILKPCTTISNIHSQGIPWATKDFIYAFVRLTNCWHILKGYWDNRDGSSLGKIEKELTPEFKTCYVRWEKETMELAGQLTKIFHNLDTNLTSASSGANVYSANNLIPPQVKLVKSASEGTIKKQSSHGEAATASTMANSNTASKNVRGIIHLPTTEFSTAETSDQANQTYAGQYFKKEEYDSKEEPTRGYSVPKKGFDVAPPGNSPRGIEFLETAQNVNKIKAATSERYWANILLSAGKKLSQDFKSISEEDEKSIEVLENDVNFSSSVNIQEWLVSSNFTEYVEPQSPTSLQELKSYYIDSTYDMLPQLDNMTLLQRGTTSNSQSNFSHGNGVNSLSNGIMELATSRSLQKERPFPGSSISSDAQRTNPYELKGSGLSEIGQCVLENIVGNLKAHILGPVALEREMNLEKIQQKIKNSEYSYINEVVRDLRYIVKVWNEVDTQNAGWFSQRLELLLVEHFNPYDFNEIKGDPNEPVGPLKACMPSFFNNNCDRII